MKHFILSSDNRTPVQVSLDEFARWCHQDCGGRYPKVADAEVCLGVRVLTQFLGTDPYGNDERLFETVVIGGEYDGYTLRHATWDLAHRGHFRTFVRVKRWVCEEKTPADFSFEVDANLLVRWGFSPTDNDGEYERTLRSTDQVSGLNGLSIFVRPDAESVRLQEYDRDGRDLATVTLPNQATIGGVMRLVQVMRHQS